jgi:putative ABC transport system permease protein
VKPSTLLLFYWWRLRVQPLQELLAAAGIAAGVALVFAVQVANTSISGSVTQLVHGITGQFSLQVAARDADGFDQHVADRVGRVNGVRLVAPVLEQRVGIAGTHARVNVDLVGVTDAISDVGGPLVDGFGGRFGPRLARALLIPQPLADRIGTERGKFVTLSTRLPVRLQVPVSATLDQTQIGTAIDSPLVVAPLAYVQELAGLPGRVTRVLVAVKPGREAQVRRALQRIAGNGLAVERSDVEISYVNQAATPNNQSTGLFAGICAIVGCLLTFNAMLLTVPERRRFADLRIQGYKRRHLLVSIAFEAAVLTTVAAALGLALGALLVRGFFHASPGYLSFAFPVGGQVVVGLKSVVVALAGGVVATSFATIPLLRELLARRPLDAAPSDDIGAGEALTPRARGFLAGGGCLLLVAATALSLLAPALTLLCIGLLALAMLALVPGFLAAFLALLDRAIDGVRGSALPLTVMQLRDTITRATALAAIGALAVFGTVAIEGAHRDVLHGLDVTAASMLDTADVWVTAPGDENILMTTPFVPPNERRLYATGKVADVREYRGQFLDMAGRRIWIMARPPGDRTPVPPTQIRDANPASVERLVRDGGYAAISASLAEELHIRRGDVFTMPTPTGPRRLLVAALVSNLGWGPGTIVLNGNDYRRWSPGLDVTALEVDLRPGVSPSVGRQAVQRALGPNSPLLVETQAQRKARFGRLERQGLNRLSQISLLLLVAAVLAMGAAMAGTAWQQRQRLAALRMQGFSVPRVLRFMLTQAAVILVVGTVAGALFGLYGQALATRWLRRTTGFPTTFDVSLALAVAVLAIVAVLALMVVSVPGYFAARTAPELALRND